MTIHRTIILSHEEYKIEAELLRREDVTREQLIYYILKNVHIGKDQLDDVIDSLIR